MFFSHVQIVESSDWVCFHIVLLMEQNYDPYCKEMEFNETRIYFAILLLYGAHGVRTIVKFGDEDMLLSRCSSRHFY